jgi:hypothetical protein
VRGVARIISTWPVPSRDANADPTAGERSAVEVFMLGGRIAPKGGDCGNKFERRSRRILPIARAIEQIIGWRAGKCECVPIADVKYHQPALCARREPPLENLGRA